MEEKTQEIVVQSSSLFMRLGVKSLTMDELAFRLGISKKTLYNHVRDKNDLVLRCMKYIQTNNQSNMDQACQESSNAIEELRMSSEIARGVFRNMQPSVFFDLQKYYPKAWKVFLDFKNEYMYNCIVSNIERGKSEGLYRDDVKTELVSLLYLNLINGVFDSNSPFHNKFPFGDLHHEMVIYHLHGIANEKGLKLIRKYFD
ncbi:MAG TPA: hypothetical protein DDX92_12520 [Flavobacteriales bacterium]|jgi:AcrR family transcriptional regulator|nr:hypothetical protein [Flavobacteriales bacterium]